MIMPMNAQRFVIQKHHARTLHYDFRLEMPSITGLVVLKSWAVPKNLPLETGTKRLAVQTEDHDVDYIDFEGEIPAGQYGAGKVEIWDYGHWSNMKAVPKPWRLEFTLTGQKVWGSYILSNWKAKGPKHWLIWRVE